MQTTPARTMQGPDDVADAYVSLICIPEGAKIRVRIVSPGYLGDANCQISRGIRAPGRQLRVPKEDVALVMRGEKWFYTVRGARIEIVAAGADCAVRKVFECADNGTCIVCMANASDTVCAPCGHAYACGACAEILRAAPECCVCRQRVHCYVPRSLVC